MQAAVLQALADVVGAAHCLAGADRGPFVVEGRTPAAVVFPGTVDEVGRVVRTAADAGIPVIPWGGGTAMALGAPPPDGALVVGTRRLGRVVEHEPGDLTATVESGITMAALQAALGARGQWLPLDPPGAARATLGGVLATNAAGPRRHLYGTARDLVIGIGVVGPDGGLVRAGGKVVKNVAGYDLAKLYIGALGTLGVVVDVTLKLRPRPEADLCVWATFGDLARASAAAGAVVGSDLGPYAVELCDAGAAALVEPGAAGPGLLVGFDGLPAAVAWQRQAATRLLEGAGAARVLTPDAATGARMLEAVREVRAGVAEPVAIATAGVPPAATGAWLAAAAAIAQAAGLRLVATAHAGHGRATLVLGPGAGGPPGRAATVDALQALRDGARAEGGHLVLEWAPLGVKETLAAWDPPGPALGLMRALKERLDPKGVMNPGRFVGGL